MLQSNQVLSFFRAYERGDWSQRELAEFYRVEDALTKSGVGISTDRGLTDEGDIFAAEPAQHAARGLAVETGLVVERVGADHPAPHAGASAPSVGSTGCSAADASRRVGRRHESGGRHGAAHAHVVEAHARHILFREESRYPGYYYRGDHMKLDDANWHCFTLSRYDRDTGKWAMKKAPVYHIID